MEPTTTVQLINNKLYVTIQREEVVDKGKYFIVHKREAMYSFKENDLLDRFNKMFEEELQQIRDNDSEIPDKIYRRMVELGHIIEK